MTICANCGHEWDGESGFGVRCPSCMVAAGYALPKSMTNVMGISSLMKWAAANGFTINRSFDLQNDIVMPGAFAKTLKKSSAIPMLWQHDPNQVIGKLDSLEERDGGLYAKGTIKAKL